MGLVVQRRARSGNGGHGRIAAVISQVPHMDGFATARMSGFRQSMRPSRAAWRDRFRGWFGKSPYYVPAFGKPGDPGTGDRARRGGGKGGGCARPEG